MSSAYWHPKLSFGDWSTFATRLTLGWVLYMLPNICHKTAGSRLAGQRNNATTAFSDDEHTRQPGDLFRYADGKWDRIEYGLVKHSILWIYMCASGGCCIPYPLSAESKLHHVHRIDKLNISATAEPSIRLTCDAPSERRKCIWPWREANHMRLG